MAKKNTPEQIAHIKRQEEAWALERTWPIWHVVLIGDPVEWKPRADPNHWEEILDEDGVGTGEWVPKNKKDLPKDVEVSENGMIVKAARCTVNCRARSRDEAVALALRDNTYPGSPYHTVESVKQVDE